MRLINRIRRQNTRKTTGKQKSVIPVIGNGGSWGRVEVFRKPCPLDQRRGLSLAGARQETISHRTILHAEAHRGKGAQASHRTCGLYFSPKVQRPHSFQISVGHRTLTHQAPFLFWLWDLQLMTKWPAQVLCSPHLSGQLTPKSKAVYLLLGGPSLYFNFLFCIRVQLINNAVIVSGEQWRDSAIPIHVSILPQTPLPSRLPHNTEQSSMCYTVGPCWLSILFYFFSLLENHLFNEYNQTN